jgi:hypothetical protein
MLVVVVAIEEPITSEVTSMQRKAKQSKANEKRREDVEQQKKYYEQSNSW